MHSWKLSHKTDLQMGKLVAAFTQQTSTKCPLCPRHHDKFCPVSIDWKKNQRIQARKAIRGEVNVYKAVTNAYSKSAEYNYIAREQYRDDYFGHTFYYGSGFKHPLKTHEMETEDGSVIKNTVCSCRKHGTGSQNPHGSSQLLVTSVPGDPAALFCIDTGHAHGTHTYICTC